MIKWILKTMDLTGEHKKVKVIKCEKCCSTKNCDFQKSSYTLAGYENRYSDGFDVEWVFHTISKVFKCRLDAQTGLFSTKSFEFCEHLKTGLVLLWNGSNLSES